MKKGFLVLTLFSAIFVNCFAEDLYWVYHQPAKNPVVLPWSTLANWQDASGAPAANLPGSTTTAIIEINNVSPNSIDNVPSLNTNLSLHQLQLLGGNAGNVLIGGINTSLFSFSPTGLATDPVTTTNAQIVYKESTGMAVSISVPTGEFIRILDSANIGPGQYTTSSFDYVGSDPTKDLFSGAGTVVVGQNTTLGFSPSQNSTDYTTGFMFTGTINLLETNSNWEIISPNGPVVSDILGVNQNSRIILDDDTTFQKNQSFSGIVHISGADTAPGTTCTLGASLSASTSGANVVYNKGEFPNAAILFEGENSHLVISDSNPVALGSTTVGGLFEDITGTTTTINLNTNNLTINQTRDTIATGIVSGRNIFSGTVSGPGGIVKAGDNDLTFNGDNAYLGATTVNAGKLILNGSHASTGATVVNSSGILNVNGDISASSGVTVNSGGTVSGTGTLPAVTVSAGGTVRPGNSIGTLTIDGNLTLDSSSATTIEISSDDTSKIVVGTPTTTNATAAVDGALTLIVPSGHWLDQTTFAFLTSTGASTGTFSSYNPDGSNFVLTYGANGVSIVSDGHHIKPHPNPPPPHHHNSHHAIPYFTALDNISFNGDISFVINRVLNQNFTMAEFEDAMLRLTGLIYHGLERASVQTMERKARSVDEMFISRAESKQTAAMQYTGSVSPHEGSERSHKEFRSVYGQNETSFYFEPYGVIYHQGETGHIGQLGQVPFVNQTVGFGGGYELVFDDNYVFEVGAGYSYSALQWENQYGHAHWNSLYLAPFLGWFDDTTFLNGMVLGQCNFNRVQRQVTFEGLDAKAHGKYVSYDLMLRLNGGHRLALHRKGDVTDWLQAEGTLNFISMFHPGLKESSNKSLELKIKSKVQYVLQPRLTAKWIHEIVASKYILAPVFKMGWVGSYQANKHQHSAKLALSPTNEYFKSVGYEHINQMMIGGELFYKSPRSYKVTTGIETLFLDHTAVVEGSVKWEWLF